MGRHHLITCLWHFEVKSCSSCESSGLGFGCGSGRVFPGTLRAPGLNFREIPNTKNGISVGHYVPYEGRRFAGFCLEFALDRFKAILHPRPGYMPNVPMNIACSAILQAFILLLSCRETKRSLICFDQLGSFRFTFTGLPSGIRLTSCWFASVHPDRVPQLPSRLSENRLSRLSLQLTRHATCPCLCLWGPILPGVWQLPKFYCQE